jgi:3-dehydroquinate synthase
MKKISLRLAPSSKVSEILISPLSDAIVKELEPLASRFALFCDEAVAKLHGSKWAAHLQKLGLNVSLFTFPPGEQEKCRERKAELEDRLFSQKFGQGTCLIALGGGVTTDLIGYLGSTYCRGVPLVFVPTTLLAMVDAAIGGKTGVNTRYGKNLIGSYYPAEKILIDLSLLSSLPSSEWTNGAAEVIKYGLIRSPTLFESLKHWKPEDPAYLEKIIVESVSIKANVVETDYEEKTGLRRILNFGHTIAHALELLEDYRLSHGEAVAIGMLVESCLSMKLGHLKEEAFLKIEKCIRSFPFALKTRVTKSNLHSALELDKKAAQGSPRFVLLEKIGACHPFGGEYCTEVPMKTLDEALEQMGVVV